MKIINLSTKSGVVWNKYNTIQSRILRGSLCSYITIARDIALDHKARVYNKSLPEWRRDKASCRHFQESRQTVTFFENERSYMTFYIGNHTVLSSIWN